MGGGGGGSDEREQSQEQLREISQRQLELEQTRLEQQRRAQEASQDRLSLLEEQQRARSEEFEQQLSLLREQEQAAQEQFVDFSRTLDDITNVQEQQLSFLQEQREEARTEQQEAQVQANVERAQNLRQRDILTDRRNQRVGNARQERRDRSLSLNPNSRAGVLSQ